MREKRKLREEKEQIKKKTYERKRMDDDGVLRNSQYGFKKRERKKGWIDGWSPDNSMTLFGKKRARKQGQKRGSKECWMEMEKN